MQVRINVPDQFSLSAHPKPKVLLEDPRISAALPILGEKMIEWANDSRAYFASGLITTNGTIVVARALVDGSKIEGWGSKAERDDVVEELSYSTSFDSYPSQHLFFKGYRTAVGAQAFRFLGRENRIYPGNFFSYYRPIKHQCWTPGAFMYRIQATANEILVNGMAQTMLSSNSGNS